MRKTVSAVLVSIMVIVAVVAIGIAVVLHPWVQVRIARHFLGPVAERTNTHIELDELHLELSGIVTVGGLRVTEADGRTLLAFDRVQFAFAPRALLQRSVQVRRGSIVGLELDLHDDDELNIATFLRAAAGTRDTGEQRDDAPAWQVDIASVSVGNARVSYTSGADPTPAVSVRGASFDVPRIAFSDDSVSAGLRRLTAEDVNGARLTDGSIQLSASPRELRLERFEVSGDGFSVNAGVDVFAADGHGVFSPESRFTGAVYDTRIAASVVRQLLDIVDPDGRSGTVARDLTVTAAAEGTLGSLSLRELTVTLGDEINLAVSAEIFDLLSRDNFAFDVTIDRFETHRDVWFAFAPALPESPWIPERVSIAGTVSGSWAGIVASLAARSETADLDMDLETGPFPAESGPLDALKAVELDLRLFDGARLSLGVDAVRDSETRSFRGTANIANVDFEALGFVQRQLVASAASEFDVEFDEEFAGESAAQTRGAPTRFRGAVGLSDVRVLYDGTEYTIDWVSVVADSTGAAERHLTSLGVGSDLLDVEVTSTFEFPEIAEVIVEYAHAFADSTAPFEPRQRDGEIDVTLVVHRPQMIADLLPAVESVRELAGHFSYVGADASATGEISADGIMVGASPVDEQPIDATLTVEYHRDVVAARLDARADAYGVNGTGTYTIADGGLDLVFETSRIDLSHVAHLVPDEITVARGAITGIVTVSGTVDSPEISGEVSFYDAEVVVARLGTGFSLGSESIVVEQNIARFSSFAVHDASGNRLELDGTVQLQSPAAPVFDLWLRSGSALVLDTDRSDDPRFHGRLTVGADLRLTGIPAHPVLGGAMRLLTGSSATFVLPDTGGMVADAAGVVRFVDEPADSVLEPTERRTSFEGLTLDVTLEIDPNTELNLIVDPRSGDRLTMRGGGDLSLGVDPAGALSLAGRYDITDGRYVLSFYSITRREFSISPGSSIVWTGDPLAATLDVTAVYAVRAAVAPLLSPSGTLTNQQTSTAGELPFHVVLTLQGTLERPDVAFSIDMPASERGEMGGAPYAAVQAINERESRRNAQAFALVVLNQFIADDLAGFDETAVVTGGARRSAAQLLTYQLNALSQRAIPGLDLTFEIDSFQLPTEHGPEGRTEIAVSLRQPLFDDRLVVELGGRVGVEGERPGEDRLFAGDVSVEYLLTSDGRYRLRGFHETEYDGPLHGTGTRTGVSFVFRHVFDRLRAIFPRTERPDAVTGAEDTE
ncbi:MAG: hypothetical protein EA426_02970 [Spirochaetaceae bacterium]|nr:MAG: hypothetical protein EA426_02970 [Spirochaetaceae bacterium]